MDRACAIVVAALLALGAVGYGARLVARGRARHPRVEREGKSALLGKGAMEMFYWCVEPLAVACEKSGVSADAVTWSSLLFGFAAATALALGHLGLGALLAALSGILDAVDGLVARRLGSASEAGELLDAVVDRYVDFALLAGLAILFRDRMPLLILVLGAVQASFMVSYSTAKAEALRVRPPRGSMKRSERAVLLVLGCALAAIMERDVPLVVALALVAVVGNVSAIRRFASIRAALRAPTPQATPLQTSE